MRSIFRFGFLVLVVAVFFIGCAKTSSVQTFNDSGYFQKSVPLSKIERAIKAGANRKGWRARKVKRGLIEADILVRGKYFVAVNIKYNPYGYKILYANSRNLKYNPADNSIHPSYNKWVSLLEKNINYELSNIGMNNADYTEPKIISKKRKMKHKKVVYKKANAINLEGRTIYIRPMVQYAPNSRVARNIKEECTVPKALAESIAKYSQAIGVDVEVKDRIGKNDLELIVKIEEAISAGNAFVGHRKFIVISGMLVKGKKIYYSFDAARLSGGGYFGAYRSSCSVLGRIARALGKDVANWLSNPYDKAMMGDTQLIR